MYGYEVFHEELMDTLIGAVRDGRSPHSYIFEGEVGLGKHLSAALLAAANCCNEELSPCGTCKSCTMAKAGTHPDIKHIKPDGDKKTIGVDVIRTLNADALIKPFYSSKKVYIIEGDLLTTEAQNSLLKTLEEPPMFAVFIIVASDLSLLLPTIVSRCAMVHFPGLSTARMKKHIREKYNGLSGGNFDFYITYANGNPGRLDALLHSSEFSIIRDECYKAASGILSSDYNEAFAVSDFFEQYKDELSDVLDILLLFFRDILFISEGMTNKVTNTDYIEKLRTVAGFSDAEKLLSAIDKISVCSEMKKRNVGAKYIGMYLALSVKEGLN